MSRADFERSTPEEFNHVCRFYHKEKERMTMERWEQVRTLAAIVIQPHVRKRITPRQLIPLPWDKKKECRDEKPEVTKDEAKKRFEELAKRGLF